MWDHREETRDITTFKALPLSGETVRQMETARVTLFDGPNYRPIDLLDFFPNPVTAPSTAETGCAGASSATTSTSTNAASWPPKLVVLYSYKPKSTA